MPTVSARPIPYPIAPVVRGRAPAAREARPGMGAIPHDKGVAFRVWAPHATAVSVVGTFNGWGKAKHPMVRENEDGYWYADLSSAKIGDEYRYVLQTPAGELSRIDPYAREVTNSVGNGVVHDPHFDWEEDYFPTPHWNEWVIYELHVGTFNDEAPDDPRPAQFESVVRRFDHLKKLGVNCIQVMPIAEFAGDRSWGYNPAHMFAVESAYGGPKAFKKFVKAAHQNGFAVILDVVYNHFGPLLLQRLAEEHPLGRQPPRLRPPRGAPVHPRQRDDVDRGLPRRRLADGHDAVHPQRAGRR
jgi:1,4-alpha-glucan branching enzyme